MKLNKFTSALIGLGIVSLAGAAHATTTIYITGSTAARANFFTAATVAGEIFTGGGTIISGAPNNTSSANTIVYEGNITGVGDVIINCSWTGSEAGIASVAGKPLNQTLFQAQDPNAAPGGTSYGLPGVPPSYLTPASGYASTALLSAIPGAPTTPDFSMADTSQKVSQTPAPLLTDYGIVGIVPFTAMKGYESAPDATYGRVSNVPQPALAQAVVAGEVLNAFYLTGNTADSADGIGIIGRNLGSGTKANFMLSGAILPINQTVSQVALNSGYPAGNPGVLTFNGPYGPAASVTDSAVGNDGFDSGSGVQKCLNVDGSGKGIVYVGYVGLSDAKHAAADDNTGPGGTGSAANSGTAVYLSYNGVYESDSAIETGAYTWWGQEHLFGTAGQGAPATTVGNAILAGLNVQTSGIVNPGGDVRTALQNSLLPVSSMQVYRTQDYGAAVQGSWPTPYQFTH